MHAIAAGQFGNGQVDFCDANHCNALLWVAIVCNMDECFQKVNAGKRGENPKQFCGNFASIAAKVCLTFASLLLQSAPQGIG